MSDDIFSRRSAGAVVNLAAAGVAAAATVFTRSTGYQGTRSHVIRKINMRNNAGGNTFVHIGTGVGGGVFVDAIPAILLPNNMDLELTEDSIPGRDLFASITAYPETLVAAGSVDIQVEVEEKGA